MLSPKMTILKLLLIGAALVCVASASIDTSNHQGPVKVTHRNSGPRYDIDEIERTRLISGRGEQPASRVSESPEEQEAPAVGHLSIRRIFLVPMMPGPVHPSDNIWSQGSTTREHEQEAPREPSMFRHQPQQDRQLWPFMTPSIHHLFGMDSASRSPNADREQPVASPEERERAQATLIDPIQMMMEMMQQALNSRPPTDYAEPKAANSADDLNKEASGTSNKENSNPASPTSELERPIKPLNETKEEVIEMDGKKYLRKTIINRHVGENMIFMTKRLMFVPLNETNSENMPTTTTTPSSPTTTTVVIDEASTTTTPPPTTTMTSTTELPTTELPATTTTTEKPKRIEETTTTEAPSTSPASSEATTEAASSQPDRPEEMTTSKVTTEQVDRSNERLMMDNSGSSS